jgi:hypothetical protein
MLAELRKNRRERSQFRLERTRKETEAAGGLQKALSAVPKASSPLVARPSYRPSPPIPASGSEESKPWYVRKKEALEAAEELKRREARAPSPEPKVITKKTELAPTFTGRAQERFAVRPRRKLVGTTGSYGTGA